MSAIPPNAKPADDRNLVTVDENYVAPGFEDKLRLFWEKNSRLVIGFVVVILLAIVAKEAWDYMEEQQARAVSTAFGEANTPEKLKAFISEHGDDPLAGLAHLRLADAAYTAGDFAGAYSSYQQALPKLVAPEAAPLAARARLGSAVALLQAGKTAEASAALKAVGNDASLPVAIRVEALYDLAVQAATAGQTDEVVRLEKQVTDMDKSGLAAQRMKLLVSRTSGGAPLPKVPTASAITAPAASNSGSPSVTISFPASK